VANKWQMMFLSVLPSKPRAATALYGKGVTNRCNNIEHKARLYVDNILSRSILPADGVGDCSRRACLLKRY